MSILDVQSEVAAEVARHDAAMALIEIAEWQARRLARNFDGDYRVRDSRGKVVLFVESSKRGP